MTETFHKTVTIKAVDEEARTATGAVLVPDELDHQGDFFRPDAVERFHNPEPDTGVMHSAFPEDAAEMERLEVIDEAETIDGEEFPAGTLVATRRYTDDELFALVDDGVLTGFSIGGDIADAREHETVPDDVRIPDGVEFERDDGAVELVDGEINEISDVDIPAVPRATYKSDLGKALLDDVDGEAEFVDLLVEQRGHDESEARRLYQYLTDVRDKTRRRDLLDKVGKPFESPQGAEFEDFEDCVDTLMDDDMTREEAEEVCGAWQDESKNKVDINGTEVDLTPPDAVINAAEAALEAKRERFPDALGDCGSGVGEDRAERIIANDLRPEDFAGGENTAIPDYLDSHSEDVDGISQPPTDWDEETWTDGCGPVQYALWGGTATGTGLEWANQTEQQVLDAMETESRMTTDSTDDGIDDATKLQVIKSWLTGSDDSDASGEAPETAKATDDEEDDDDEDDDEEMADDNDKHADMTDDTEQSDDPPEWAKSLTDSVEQIDERVSKLEGDDEADKMDDAPEWAQDLAEKVDDLDGRVDAISKQSGHSQQLDATEDNDSEKTADEVEQFKKGLVGASGGD